MTDEHERAPPPARYHHGDLRRVVLDTALQELSRGEEELSFRRLAAAAGVARSAPYNHFRDRGELLAVLAGEGFTLLREALEAARRGAGTRDAAAALARAYVHFGRERFAHYRVMFLPVVTRPENVRHVHPPAQACFDLLAQALDRRPGDDAAGVAREIWCALHGLVLLAQDAGPLGFPDAARAEQAFVDRLVTKLTA